MVKTSDCGSDMRGFESHHPPHFIGVLLGNLMSQKDFRQNKNYRLASYVGYIGSILLFISYNAIPNGEYANIGQRFIGMIITIFLWFVIISVFNVFLRFSFFVSKQQDNKSNIIHDIGVIIGYILGVGPPLLCLISSLISR